MWPGFFDNIKAPFFVWNTMSNHVVKQDTYGPYLALDIDDLGAYFELWGNKLFIAVAVVQIKGGSERATDFSHGWQIANFENSIFVYDKLWV